MTDLNALARRATHDVSHVPIDVRRWLDQARWTVADGYPRGTGQIGAIQTSDISDSTGDSATSNTTGTGHGYGPSDKHTLVGQQLRIIIAAVEIIDGITREATAHADINDRCTGLLDPTCRNLRAGPVMNMAGEQVDPGLCVDCLTLACPVCVVRPIATEPPRRLPSRGIRSCEACYRREKRDAA